MDEGNPVNSNMCQIGGWENDENAAGFWRRECNGSSESGTHGGVVIYVQIQAASDRSHYFFFMFNTFLPFQCFNYLYFFIFRASRNILPFVWCLSVLVLRYIGKSRSLP